MSRWLLINLLHASVDRCMSHIQQVKAYGGVVNSETQHQIRLIKTFCMLHSIGCMSHIQQTGQGHWWGCELCSKMSRWLLLNTFCMHHHIDAWATYNRSRPLLGLWTLKHNVKVVLIKTFCMHHLMDAWATYNRSRSLVGLWTLQHNVKVIVIKYFLHASSYRCMSHI